MENTLDAEYSAQLSPQVRRSPMSRIGAIAIATVAAALTLAGAGSAATVTVQIRSNGFSPGTITITHGDKVTWHNADKTQHQVVANDGSFASPILRAGQSWTFTFVRAGVFRYHDAFVTRLTGKITVKGPPPSVSLALSAPIIDYGTQVTLSGTVSNAAANESVEIDQQPWGQSSPTQLAIVKTGANGAYSYAVTPTLYTTYVARWNKAASGNVVVQVAPKLRLAVGGHGYMKASVSSPVSLWHRHLFLQRRSPFGQWVNVAALVLGRSNGRVFKPAAYLPRGVSHIRVFLSVNQAGNGLLAAHSGTQTVRRR
jgi:plastocyanin